MSDIVGRAAVLALMVVAVWACQPATGSASPGATARPLADGEFPVATIAPPADALAACPAALVTGILVEFEPTGLGLVVADGTDPIIGVRWPFGYRGAVGPPPALLDDAGQVVATTDTLVEVGGGYIGDEWLGCGGVRALE